MKKVIEQCEAKANTQYRIALIRTGKGFKNQFERGINATRGFPMSEERYEEEVLSLQSHEIEQLIRSYHVRQLENDDLKQRIKNYKDAADKLNITDL